MLSGSHRGAGSCAFDTETEPWAGMQRPRQGVWCFADVLPWLLVAFTFNECLHRSSAQNITYRQASFGATPAVV